MNEPIEAVRHRAADRPCCPEHGLTLGATQGQPVPVAITGEPWILYDSGADGINADRVLPPSKTIDGNAFAMTYICGVGNHPVVVYRVMNRPPLLGRIFQVTRGEHAAWYHDKNPVHVPVTGEMRYPVAEALLRRVWGLQAVTDKRRAQRHARKKARTDERNEARTQRRKPLSKRAPGGKR